MPLDGPALNWFQDIPKNAYTNLEEMEKDLVEAISLIDIKHNTTTQIYNFKQVKYETIRDYSKKLKKYILRCPKAKIPSQDRLVSIFIESLINRKLHVALYLMKHKTLAASIKDEIKLDENCDEYKDGRTTSVGYESSQRSTESKVIV